MKKEKWDVLAAFLAGLFALTLVALWYARQTGADFFAHCATDSYTLQALAWRAGKTTIDGDLPWLELAIYEGKQYLSFPPVPTLPLFVLTFFFGGETPSGALTLLYLLGGYAAGFFLCARRMRPGSAALLSLFVCAGGSLMDVAVSDGSFCGAVWYQAQMLAFLLTMLAFLLLDGKSRRGWYWGLVCYALAIGCRPFNIAMAPAVLWLLAVRLSGGKPRLNTVRAMIPFCIAPFCIGCAYGCYNLARFGSFFEFGHVYLPEYVQSGDEVFSLRYVMGNVRSLLRWPSLADGQLVMPAAGGFAVVLTQPQLFLALGWTVWRACRRRLCALDAVTAGCICLQACALLLHRTLGGWQYGARYFCDMLPAVLYLRARMGRELPAWEASVNGGAMTFNLLASVMFHAM